MPNPKVLLSFFRAGNRTGRYVNRVDAALRLQRALMEAERALDVSKHLLKAKIDKLDHLRKAANWTPRVNSVQEEVNA
ncbi:MAG: hypothetical protein R3F23_09295, partial [Verrucomicrobiia bacterium]